MRISDWSSDVCSSDLTINFAALAELSADGTSGGDAGFSGGTIPLGRGGSVLIRTVADPTNSSTIQIDTLTVGVDGATATAFEMLPGMGSGGGVGNGEGGSATLDLQGGSLTAGRSEEHTSELQTLMR